MKKKIVIIYSLIHFIVDFSCVILVANLIKGMNTNNLMLYFLGVIIYNFCGFVLQFPIGIIADKINKNAIISAIGCLLVIIGYIFFNIPIIACIIAGVGNALFHIGGGIDVLNISEKKATLSGIYVSTGAMGVFLGTMSYKWQFDMYWIIIVILMISIILLSWLYSKIKDKVKNNDFQIPKLSKNAILAIICFFITVCIRSYVGMILSFSWKSEFIFALFAILGVVFGKILGGIIGDKLGFEKISITLILSAVLFIFSFQNPIIGIIAILLFNMTMPITLICLSNIFINNKGLAFGLLTVALFIGAAPTFFGYNGIFTKSGLFTTTIISAAILYIALILYRKEMERHAN